MANGSRKTVAASRKGTPCILWFFPSFSGSHSNSIMTWPCSFGTNEEGLIQGAGQRKLMGTAPFVSSVSSPGSAPNGRRMNRVEPSRFGGGPFGERRTSAPEFCIELGWCGRHVEGNGLGIKRAVRVDLVAAWRPDPTRNCTARCTFGRTIDEGGG
jgi:hypothetical protein